MGYPKYIRRQIIFMPSTQFFRIADFIAFVLFAISAWLQLNDPDPFLWFGLYGFMATLSLSLLIPASAKLGHQGLRILRWVLLAFCLIWAMIHWPWSEEEWREVGGAALLTLWLWWRSDPPTSQIVASEP